MKRTIFLLPLLLTGCFYGSLLIEQPDIIQSALASLPPLENGKAQVCFIREENSWGILPGVWPDIKTDDSTIIGTLKPATYFCANLPAKPNTFTSNSLLCLDRHITFTPCTNERTYVEWAIKDYVISQTSELRLLTPDQALSKIHRIQEENK